MRTTVIRHLTGLFVGLFSVLSMLPAPAVAQQTLGAITGTVKDATGAVIPDAVVKARNIDTNLEVTEHTNSSGSYSVQNLPIGIYALTFSKAGFKTETHTQVLVNSDRTATVDGTLQVGAVSSTVEVTSTPLMNQVDTTNGYVVDQLTIQQTPLGTGSFTQLAILSPGVHADFLGGAGSNSGLGNQAIFANGQRDTSNSFSLNGVNTNNLFNGNSTSQVGENRFVLNTGENFGAGGQIQTSTSVYGAIGQALPTPPVEAIQEISVNAAMYDATQGANSGAHIGVITKSGTNEMHGEVYEKFQNSDMNAAPFFYNASPIITDKVPFLNRNQFGATLGGPIKKNKLFYFVSYQGVRIADATDSTKDVTVPLGLTNDRSVQGIINAVQSSFGTTLTPSQVSPWLTRHAAGQAAQRPVSDTERSDHESGRRDRAWVTTPSLQGPNAQSNVDQGIANVDYVVNDKDRLIGQILHSGQSHHQSFWRRGFGCSGFRNSLQPAARSLPSTTPSFSLLLTGSSAPALPACEPMLKPARRSPQQDFGMNLLGSTQLSANRKSTPPIPPLLSGLQFGASPSFGNAGMYQNQWEYGTSLNWVKGKHTISAGVTWDHTQLNIINNNTNSDSLNFKTFTSFVEGNTYAPGRPRVRGFGQSLLSVQHGRGIRQRQLQSPQQPYSHPGPSLGLRWPALGEVRPADQLRFQALWLRCRHRYHHRFRTGIRR